MNTNMDIKTTDNTDNKLMIINKKQKNLSKLENLFLFFFIFSILGWICETAYTSIGLGLTKRGFLYGPYCPIYGCGAIMLIIANSYIDTNKVKHKYIKLFFGAIIIFSLFEYIVGYGLEALFLTRAWDYTYDLLNLNGRISLFYCVGWGLAAILFTKFLYPFYLKGCKWLNKFKIQTKHILTGSFALILIVDIIFSCIKYLSIS